MSRKKLLFIIGILIMILCTLLYLVFKRSKGQDGFVDKVGELTVSSSEQADAENVYRVDVEFRTGNEAMAVPISSLSFRLVMDGGQVSVVDENGFASSQAYPYEKIVDSDEWSFPVNNVVNEDGKLMIDFAAINTSTEGFVNQGYMPVASFYLALDEGLVENVDLVFDLDFTKMMTKQSPPQDILDIPGNLSFTIGN